MLVAACCRAGRVNHPHPPPIQVSGGILESRLGLSCQLTPSVSCFFMSFMCYLLLSERLKALLQWNGHGRKTRPTAVSPSPSGTRLAPLGHPDTVRLTPSTAGFSQGLVTSDYIAFTPTAAFSDPRMIKAFSQSY